MKLVAVLDADNRLVGTQEVEDDVEGVTLPAKHDLTLDGTYVFRDGAFWPLGYGFPKPVGPPVAQDHAAYLMMRSLLDGTPLPAEVRVYADWYRDTLLSRVEEKMVGDKRRAGQGTRLMPRTVRKTR